LSNYDCIPSAFGRAKTIDIDGTYLNLSTLPKFHELEDCSIRMRAVSHWELQSILKSAPKLRHLTFIGTSTIVGRADDTVLGHPKLETLILNFIPLSMVPGCHFPSLRHIEMEPEQREKTPNAIYILDNIPNPERCEEIGLWMFISPVPAHLSMLYRFEFVTTLTFRCFSGSFGPTVNLLESMIPESFPSLTELKLLDGQPSGSEKRDTTGVGDSILRLVTRREAIANSNARYSRINSIVCNVDLQAAFHERIAAQGVSITQVASATETRRR
jgi:hypothetical protein